MAKFSPCIVIPNYNHGQFIEQVILSLEPFAVPIIMVNDGSNEETRLILESLDKKYDLLSVIHLEVNSGKGAAVLAGFRVAHEHGFSHALQVDADGQHDISDIEKFLSLSEKSPEAVIVGTPIYDESVPLGRLIPRYITHFWVWIETLSFKLKDSMCGFRVYPLEPTIQLISEEPIGSRMDFDTDILVRLYWRAVPMIQQPTKVIYPEEGTSQFNLLKDNWLITKMHTRLFFGMLKRFPRLIKQKLTKPNAVHWSNTDERGSSVGISILIFIYRYIGRWLFKIVLFPVTLYFVLSGKTARNASYQYLNRIFEFQALDEQASFAKVFKHFYQFSLSAIDKVSAWLGEFTAENTNFIGNEHFEQLSKSKKGAIFIGSHLGNIELCRALGQKNDNVTINALVFTKHALRFQEAINKVNPDSSLNLIQVDSIAPDTAIMLKQKVEAGEIVVIVGDRTSTSNYGRTKAVDFLGHKAPFAEGPFILAGILDCPVYLLFCIKEQKQYNVYLEPFADSLKFPRKDRQQILQKIIQSYANRLEHYCLKAPYQWFNFYDFWCPDDQNSIQKDINSSTSENINNAN